MSQTKLVRWTPREDAILVACYDEGERYPIMRAASLLPHRTIRAIRMRASRIGAMRSHWSEQETNDIIEARANREPYSSIARRLGRTEVAVRAKYHRERHRDSIKRGMVYVQEAARRCGVDRSVMTHIIRSYKIKTTPPIDDGGRAARYVDLDRARAAVDDWNSRECVGAVAKRLGVETLKLKAMMVAAGEKQIGNSIWRIHERDARRAIAFYNAARDAAAFDSGASERPAENGFGTEEYAPNVAAVGR